jgi:hypothetical protein
VKQLRFRRGSMPDVPLHQRDRDSELLSHGAFDARGNQPRIIEFSDLHMDLQEILYRMDEAQVENLKTGLHILVRLEPEDFARVRAALKAVSVIAVLWRVLKWSVASFFAGLAAVVVAGDQLQKIWGWVTNALKVFKS